MPGECKQDLITNLKRTKSVRKAIMAEVEPKGDATGVKISFETKSEDELDKWLMDIQSKMEEIGGALIEIGNEFKPKYEDLDRQVEDKVEDGVVPKVEDLLNNLGGAAKDIADSATVDWQMQQLLAQKSAAVATQKPSKAGFYAGVTFGVLGVVAAAAAIAACNKKKIQDNEETLL